MQPRCPECNEILINSKKCGTCGWRKTSKNSEHQYKFARRVGDRFVDAQCQWNDHGVQCPIEGWMSHATNGGGPWYCAPHFFRTDDSPQGNPVSHERGRELAENLKVILENRGLAQEEPGANG